MLDPSRGPFEPFLDHVEELTLETLSPVASKVASLSLRSIFSPKPCSCLGRALQKCSLERAYVGPSWGYVGAMLAHLGLCWGHQWPARFQETLPERSAAPAGPPSKARFASATARPDLPDMEIVNKIMTLFANCKKNLFVLQQL